MAVVLSTSSLLKDHAITTTTNTLLCGLIYRASTAVAARRLRL